eukprot:COSAG01_NODE_4306_length_5147_cov_2.402932_6_plen_337_part_00
MLRLVLLAAAAAPAATAAVPPAPSPSAWNDTACHSPTDRGCETCLVANATLPGPVPTTTWLQRRWTGSCKGCLPGVPYGPQCGNCFPGVQPWYNGHQYGAPGTPPPAETTKPCSPCSLREQHDFREALFAKPDGCVCPPDPAPPVGDCPASGPGKMGCDCWCQDAAQMAALCQLPATPDTFPGPCVLDRQLAQSRNEEFDGFCNEQTGYYEVVACGDQAPPALPPSPPMPPWTPPPATAAAPTAVAPSSSSSSNSSSSISSSMRQLQPGHRGACWCVEPSYGIQNGTSAVPHPTGAPPPRLDCTETLQCELLNKNACASFPQYHLLAIANTAGVLD